MKGSEEITIRKIFIWERAVCSPGLSQCNQNRYPEISEIRLLTYFQVLAKVSFFFHLTVTI